MAEESLFAGESKNIEYKVAVPKKSEKYMKTVVAFANGNGGKIVFGIDDKTLEIVGMDEDNIFKTMDAITNAISDSCEPRIRPDVTLQTVNDRTVIVVEILPGAMRPYYIKVGRNDRRNLYESVRDNKTSRRIYAERVNPRRSKSIF